MNYGIYFEIHYVLDHPQFKCDETSGAPVRSAAIQKYIYDSTTRTSDEYRRYDGL